VSALIVNSLLSVIAAATPLLLAATGELVTERSGVLNLGVEGMMLVGAIAGFAVRIRPGLRRWGLRLDRCGALISLVFGFLTLTMLANQIATGLALTIFGRGFSALIGAGFVGIRGTHLAEAACAAADGHSVHRAGAVWPGSVDLYVVHRPGCVAWFLYRTHAGLILRSVGDFA